MRQRFRRGFPPPCWRRRPDIRQAEAQLIAANAQIGVAIAAYFPQITLTGSAGFQSSALTSLFTGPAGLWNFGGSLAQPIFAGGRIRSGVRFSEARQQEHYLSTSRPSSRPFVGFRTRWSSIARTESSESSRSNSRLSAEDAARLSETRYRGGATSYLEVLTNETNYFDAELGLAQAQLNELLGLVSIYRTSRWRLATTVSSANQKPTRAWAHSDCCTAPLPNA